MVVLFHIPKVLQSQQTKLSGEVYPLHKVRKHVTLSKLLVTILCSLKSNACITIVCNSALFLPKIAVMLMKPRALRSSLLSLRNCSMAVGKNVRPSIG